MGGLTRLAWRYLSYHRVRSLTLIGCVVLVALLPFSLEIFLGQFRQYLTERASSTPLIVGAKGSRYDLLLSSLYFRGQPGEPTSMAEVEQILEGRLATPIPLHIEHAIERDGERFPIVGTSIEYFEFRNLVARAGHLPQVLGDVVIGSQVAEALDATVGGRLTSAAAKVYDISATYPLRMKVVGVLAPTGTSDDWVAFVDLKTSWVISGIGHGHQDLKDSEVLSSDGSTKVGSAAVFMANEITPDNIDSFHFHGDPGGFPVTSIILDPKNHKAQTLLLGRYEVSERAQILKPGKVLDELLGLVLRIKQFFDANSVLVAVATGLFLFLIVTLSLRVRAREMETLFKIGCDRWTVFRLQAIELGFVVGAAVVLSAGLALILSALVRQGLLV